MGHLQPTAVDAIINEILGRTIVSCRSFFFALFCSSRCSSSSSVYFLQRAASFSSGVCRLFKAFRMCSVACKKEGKVCFYIAHNIYPVRWTAQNYLHFTPNRPVNSDTNSTSLGSIH